MTLGGSIEGYIQNFGERSTFQSWRAPERPAEVVSSVTSAARFGGSGLAEGRQIRKFPPKWEELVSSLKHNLFEAKYTRVP